MITGEGPASNGVRPCGSGPPLATVLRRVKGENAVELSDYLQVLRRRWLTVVVCALLGLGIAGALTFSATPQYQASSRLFISTTQNSTTQAYQTDLFAQQRITSYASLVTTRKLAEKVSKELGGTPDAATLQREIRATAIPDAVLLQITATDPDPAQARAISKAYTERLATLITKLETPEVTTPPPGTTAPPASALPIVKPSIVDEAGLPTRPVSPRPPLNLTLGLVLGLALGAGVAVARELLDTTVKSKTDVERAARVSVLGVLHADNAAAKVPPSESLVLQTPWAESFRVLATNMQYVKVDQAHKVLVVTSPLEQEGKSTTASNLALSLAKAGSSVVLVEGDLRRPTVASKLAMDGAVGITNVLAGKLDIDDVLQDYGDTGLAVIACGPIPPNPSELLQTEAMDKLLQELRDRYQFVVFDAPPLLPVTDAALLATRADGTVIVVRHGHTTREQLQDASERLVSVQAQAVGAVINMVPMPRHGAAEYGYSYRSSYTDSASPSRRGGAHR